MNRLAPKSLVLLLLVLLPIAFAIALIVGPELILPFSGQDSTLSNLLIIEEIRAPRALMAASIGATLAICGVMMQGLFRNPLADPSLIGVSSGASAGASFMIVIAAGWVEFQGISGITLVALGAFAGAAVTTTLVYKLAARPSGTSVSTMLLAGIAISALAGAINSFFTYIADYQMLRQISLWQMGSLSGSQWHLSISSLVTTILLLSIFFRYHKALNALLLGESEARHLGIHVERIKRQIILLVALGVGIAVALTGTIAFVGLVTPHMVRLLIGPDHRYLIPCSALAGAILLLLADACARFIIAPSELPIGVVTAFLGAPFFLSLLRQQQRESL